MNRILKSAYRLLRSYAMHLPEPLVRGIERIMEYQLKKAYRIACNVQSSPPVVISMFDGKINPGGLSDRILGVLSVYDACKAAGVKYKIFHTSPFELSDFLVPNKYDWKIGETDIRLDASSKVLFIRSMIPYKNKCRQNRLIRIVRKLKTGQLHVYSNLDSFTPGTFGGLFNELFAPSDILKQHIQTHSNNIGANYISITFRFQQLLGDFKEGNFKILGEEQKNKLLTECLATVENIKSNNPNFNILVTSDSLTFLNKVSILPYVYVIPGTIVHMAYSSDASKGAYLKSFVDLLMIANAKKIYSVKIGDMYDSGFPKIAAKIHDRPFELILK